MINYCVWKSNFLQFHVSNYKISTYTRNMKHPVVPRFPAPAGKLFLYMSRNSRISWILAKLAKVSCPSKVVGLTLRVDF